MDFLGVENTLALIIGIVGAAIGLFFFIVWSREIVLPADDARTWLLGTPIIIALIIVGATVAIVVLTLVATAIKLFGEQNILIGVAQIIGGAALLFCFGNYVSRVLRER